MPHEVNIVADQMVVLDADGNGLAQARLLSHRAAQQQIQAWAEDFVFEVAKAGRAVHDHFKEAR